MTRNVQRVLLIIGLIFIGLVTIPVGQAWAQSSSSGNNVTYSGDHGRNVRVTAENGQVVIVTGIIYSISGNRINMDGESFSLPATKIHDQLGLEVQPEQLYPGLKVRLALRNGSVESATILNFYRGKVVTDPQEVQQMRQRELNLRGK